MEKKIEYILFYLYYFSQIIIYDNVKDKSSNNNQKRKTNKERSSFGMNFIKLQISSLMNV